MLDKLIKYTKSQNIERLNAYLAITIIVLQVIIILK